MQIFAKQKNLTIDKIERIGPSKVLPPREGITVSNAQDPVYIPLGAILKSETSKDSNVDIRNRENNKHAVNSHKTGFNPLIDKLKEKISDNNKQIRFSSVSKGIVVFPTRTLGHFKKDGISNVRVPADKSESAHEDKIHHVFLEPSIKSSATGPSLASSINRKSTPDLPHDKSSDPNRVSKTYTEPSVIFITDIHQKDPIFRISNNTNELQTTKYITSIESVTKTLTITTTKVYYTRDSPLTITSLITTTIPPRTFVSTIIGLKTILGTAGEATDAIQPTQALNNEEFSTTVTTSTLVFNSVTTTVVRTLVLPTITQSTKSISSTRVPAQRPTRRPVPFRPPTRVRTQSTEAPVIKSIGTSKTRAPLPSPRPPSVPTKIPSANPGSTRVRVTTVGTIITTRANIIDNDQCRPACNAANKEICKEFDGKYKCDCRPGFIKRDGSSVCQGKIIFNHFYNRNFN